MGRWEEYTYVIYSGLVDSVTGNVVECSISPMGIRRSVMVC